MRIGFLGAGRDCYQIERFKKYDDLEVVVFLTDKTRCKEVSKLGYENFSSIEKLSHSDVDVMSISTPSNQHYSSLLKVFNTKTKCKVITIKKPTFLKQEDFDSVKKLNYKGKKILLPIFQNRYNKAVNFAKSLIEDGKLGKILNGRIFYLGVNLKDILTSTVGGKWFSDGGALTNQEYILLM